MIQDELQKLLQGITKVRPLLERSREEGHGDYSSSVALAVGKLQKRNPMEVAQELAGKMQMPQGSFERVEVAPPGFLNFFLSQEALIKELERIGKERDSYGSSKEWAGKKVIVEFTDPNPFKEFHIGHLYSNIVGESLSRLFEFQGAQVQRANYFGDVGMHVAKALWGIAKKMEEEGVTLDALSHKSLEERVRFLGESYARGAKAFEEDAKAKEEIGNLNLKIFAKDPSILPLYERGRAWSLEYFETIYQRLGTTFDFYYPESEVSDAGKEFTLQGLKKGVFQESEGAVVFPGEKYGLHTRVFINAQGLPTYEAKDMGLAPRKAKDFPYDLSLIITGSEQTDYFRVVLAALREVHPELGKKTMHIPHGFVRLASGKMSSRLGNVLAAQDFLNDVKAKAKELGGDDETAEAIALGAVKYSFLKVGIGKDIVFDAAQSLSLAGASGPYLQYANVRSKSILRNAEKLGNQVSKNLETKFPKMLAPEELSLLRTLIHFPEVAAEAAEKRLPSLVCSFAYDLAHKYNVFYNILPVLGAENQETRNFRLALTAATAQVLQNALSLLGIKTLERM